VLTGLADSSITTDALMPQYKGDMSAILQAEHYEDACG